MTSGAVVGVDIGTSSAKAVLVDLDGRELAHAAIPHEPSRPRPGHVEMDGEVWWDELTRLVADLRRQCDVPVVAVGTSGIGPCALLTDADGAPLRPAILYGVDTRGCASIDGLEAELGAAEILRATGSRLSSQSVGPKLAWVAEHEPATWSRARRLFMPSSWLVWRLTGAYRLDHTSASQATPLYDLRTGGWHERWADRLRGDVALPELGRPGDVAGHVTRAAARQTGLPEGIPVVLGTIDAWAEGASVPTAPGDLALMYGSTLFMISSGPRVLRHPDLWASAGVRPGTYDLTAGTATSGAVTSWLRRLFGGPDFAELVAEAERSPAGSRGLLMLPYFAGERTPLHDPDARGVVAGLTLEHGRGDLYRAALEATAYGVRQNLDLLRQAGAVVERGVAVGGGSQGTLWPQIVSDVTGLPQMLAAGAAGASLGAAHLAAQAVADVDIARWNPLTTRVEPHPGRAGRYDALYADYLDLYTATRRTAHHLAEVQRRSTDAGAPAPRS
ncbi:FGGY-family carbohydrate kinase [Isoptericola cucumis]|uniref:Sugar kinase n=1 Tax=Isoptericola cucumis TaxID=1776856 RepID=A0ABQ2B6T6_9MICO|nr:FGGY family carbohydrate kinase [Isoptericola cucumis]GGI08015.1 sugar kinase [Isoptericola cucumis]